MRLEHDDARETIRPGTPVHRRMRISAHCFPSFFLRIGELRLDRALASLPVGLGLRARVLVGAHGAGRLQVPPRRGRSTPRAGPAVARWASHGHLGELALGQRQLVPLDHELPLEHGDPLAMARPRIARRRPPSRRSGTAAASRPRRSASSSCFRSAASSRSVAASASRMVPTPSLRLEQRLPQAGGIGSRVAPRAVAQQLVQSRLQTFEHGRGVLGIDDASGNGPVAERRGPAAGGRPKQLGDRMVGPPPRTVKRAGLSARRGRRCVAYATEGPRGEERHVAPRAAASARRWPAGSTAPGGVVYRDAWWEVAHHTGAWTDPGELIVKARRHVESLAALTPAEAAALGPVLRAAVGRDRARRAARAGLRRVLRRARAPRALLPPASHHQPPGRPRDCRIVYRRGRSLLRRLGRAPQSHRRGPRRRGGANPRRRRMEDVEHLILGAGPAGLRAAQVLAEAGREVLVLEKHAEIGPKTCAGGLTAQDDARARAARAAAGRRRSPAWATWPSPAAGTSSLDAERPGAHDRAAELGRHQLAWARAAGAEVRAGRAGQRHRSPGAAPSRPAAAAIRWRHLIGADGADSAVRRALGLPSPRDVFRRRVQRPGAAARAAPDRVRPGRARQRLLLGLPAPGLHLARRRGAQAPRRRRPRSAATSTRRWTGSASPARTCRSRERRSRWRITAATSPVACIWPGDAAGVVSSLTAEGIYAALVTGEEVARTHPRAAARRRPRPRAGSGPSGGTTGSPAGWPGRRPRDLDLRRCSRASPRRAGSGGRSPPGCSTGDGPLATVQRARSAAWARAGDPRHSPTPCSRPGPSRPARYHDLDHLRDCLAQLDGARRGRRATATASRRRSGFTMRSTIRGRRTTRRAAPSGPAARWPSSAFRPRWRTMSPASCSSPATTRPRARSLRPAPVRHRPGDSGPRAGGVRRL